MLTWLLCMLGLHDWEEWCKADNYTWPRDSGGQFLPDDVKADCRIYLQCKRCGRRGRGWLVDNRRAECQDG